MGDPTDALYSCPDASRLGGGCYSQERSNLFECDWSNRLTSVTVVFFDRHHASIADGLTGPAMNRTAAKSLSSGPRSVWIELSEVKQNRARRHFRTKVTQRGLKMMIFRKLLKRQWRRGWDSNPRARFWQARRFRGAPVMTTSVPLRPVVGGI